MRISTTTIESFRLWRHPDNEWMSEADLLATIRGEFISSRRMEIGSAFGRVLETPDMYRVDGGYRVRPWGNADVYTFDDATMAPALALMDHTRGVFEAKGTRDYGDVTVVAKADQIVGGRLFEHKTTSGTFDFEKYAASCQWRFMVDIFAPLSVTYHVFLLDDHENGVVELKGVESFNLYPYPALHADCCELLDDFCGYARAKGLDGLLRDRQRQAEAA